MSPDEERRAPAPVTGRGLVLPDAGPPRALRTAYAHYLRATLLELLRAAERLPEGLRPAARAANEAFRGALAREPRAALAALASPGVGVPIQCLPLIAKGSPFAPRIEEELRRVAPRLLLELAARRLLASGRTLDWPEAVDLASPALGVLVRPPEGAQALRFASGRVEALRGGKAVAALSCAPLPDADASGGFRLERPYRAIGGIARLALVDDNPIAESEAHPDKSGNALSLGGRPEAEWVETLDGVLELIRGHAPGLHAEMAFLLRQVVPVGFHPERHLSASYGEAVGVVYMTLHPDRWTMAEALIHEFQHNKLNAASFGAEFLRNAFHPLYKSPVRPDPRPLWGVLLAVHAFLPVADFARRLRAARHPLSSTPSFAARLDDVDLKNREGMEVLRAHADWTPQGAALMEELDALDRRHMAERAERGLGATPRSAHEA